MEADKEQLDHSVSNHIPCIGDPMWAEYHDKSLGHGILDAYEGLDVTTTLVEFTGLAFKLDRNTLAVLGEEIRRRQFERCKTHQRFPSDYSVAPTVIRYSRDVDNHYFPVWIATVLQTVDHNIQRKISRLWKDQFAKYISSFDVHASAKASCLSIALLDYGQDIPSSSVTTAPTETQLPGGHDLIYRLFETLATAVHMAYRLSYVAAQPYNWSLGTLSSKLRRQSYYKLSPHRMLYVSDQA